MHTVVEPGGAPATTASRPPKRAPLLAVVLAALVLLASACSGSSSAVALHGEQVDPPFKVSSDQLVDDNGKPYSLTSSTDKRLTLVFFGYTHCPDICGIVMSNLAAAMTRLDASDRKQVDVVFVTTDPARDTGPVLRRYLDHLDPSFIGVTGDLSAIATVGKSVAVGMGTKLPSGGYDVNSHSTQVTAIDSDNNAPMYWHQDTTAGQFAQDIHTLLGKA